MRIHVVGSSGTFPVPGRPASGYVVEHEKTRVWCDAGPGTFINLPVDSYAIDAIVVSHQHPDHCSDLFAAFHAWTYCESPRLGVPLYAPQAVWDRIEGFLDKGQGNVLTDTFDFHPVWTGDDATIGGLSLSFTETDHSVPNVGSRWEADGKVLFYTGDTGPAGDWRSLAHDADVLLSEATYQGDRQPDDYPHHLTATEAGQIAREMKARRLVLTHIPPYRDASRSVHEAEVSFDRPVAVAVAGGIIDV
jgi:ribonuclease BN (tRNA processing enzyme)